MAFVKLTKRFMTLMEVLIALSLTIVLMTTLTYFYSQIELLSRASEGLQKQGFHTRYTENRLIQVFANTIPDFNFKQTNLGKSFCFFTSGDLHGFLLPASQSLVFLYNNQARADGDDADVNLARLLVDKKGRLILASWPPPYEWPNEEHPPAKIEILMENVIQIEFEFFVASQLIEREPLKNAINDREHYLQTVEPPKTASGWLRAWEKEYNKLPPMIKIFVRQNDPSNEKKYVDTQFAFPLPFSKDLIVYDQ